MAELKTKRNDSSVAAFLDGIDGEERRQECRALLALMRAATRAEPRMWGQNIVGFGSYHYRYASGREGDWFLAGFSPRKRELTVYVMSGFERHPALMKKLGRFRTGQSCLYLKRLADVDATVLKQLVAESVKLLSKSAAQPTAATASRRRLP